MAKKSKTSFKKPGISNPPSLIAGLIPQHKGRSRSAVTREKILRKSRQIAKLAAEIEKLSASVIDD